MIHDPIHAADLPVGAAIVEFIRYNALPAGLGFVAGCLTVVGLAAFVGVFL